MITKFRTNDGAAGWKWVILNLARSSDFPEGSESHGYQILAPLNASGHLDADLWRRHKDHGAVVRKWGDDPLIRGQLRHCSGGAGGANWIIDYDAAPANEGDKGYRLDQHRFAEGEYVSLSGRDGTQTFKIAKILEDSSSWPDSP